MKRRPYTPREVEAARMAAKFYEKGTRETIERLVATIDDLRRQLEDARWHPVNVPDDCDMCEQCFVPMPFSSERFCSDQCEIQYEEELAGGNDSEEA